MKILMGHDRANEHKTEIECHSVTIESGDMLLNIYELEDGLLRVNELESPCSLIIEPRASNSIFLRTE